MVDDGGRAALAAAMLALPDQHLSRVDAAAQADAAIEAAVSIPELDGATLVAVAWRETRLDPTVVGGHYRYCGLLQAMAHDRRACRDLADVGLGYAIGAAEIADWLRTTHGNLAAALAHHVCGNDTRAPKCAAYARGILRMAERLRAHVEVATTRDPEARHERCG